MSSSFARISSSAQSLGFPRVGSRRRTCQELLTRTRRGRADSLARLPKALWKVCPSRCRGTAVVRRLEDSVALVKALHWMHSQLSVISRARSSDAPPRHAAPRPKEPFRVRANTRVPERENFSRRASERELHAPISGVLTVTDLSQDWCGEEGLAVWFASGHDGCRAPVRSHASRAPKPA